MRLFSFALLAMSPLVAVVTTEEALVAIVTALLGGGGIFGVVKVWLASQSKRDERADARLDRILDAGREEREANLERLDRISDRFTDAIGGVTEEVRSLRGDLAAHNAAEGYMAHRAVPPHKPDGTRGA